MPTKLSVTSVVVMVLAVTGVVVMVLAVTGVFIEVATTGMAVDVR